jgi:hypothetical protein
MKVPFGNWHGANAGVLGINRNIPDRTSLGEQQPTVPNLHATITTTGQMLRRWLGENDRGRLVLDP